jgi:hypothetical protein
VDEDGKLVSHSHDPDAVIAVRQIPDPGQMIDSRTDLVEIFVGLRPGIPV